MRASDQYSPIKVVQSVLLVPLYTHGLRAATSIAQVWQRVMIECVASKLLYEPQRQSKDLMQHGQRRMCGFEALS